MVCENVIKRSEYRLDREDIIKLKKMFDIEWEIQEIRVIKDEGSSKEEFIDIITEEH